MPDIYDPPVRETPTYERSVRGTEAPYEPPVPERETTTFVKTTSEAPPPRGFSLGATFLGWAVASFFSLVFLALLVGALGGTAINGYYPAVDGPAALATAGIVGYLVCVFLGFLIGGYAAGRIAIWQGALHGALMVVWAIVSGAVLFAISSILGDVMITYAAVGIPFTAGELTLAAVLWGLATVALMAGGGALGGRLGERVPGGTRETLERRRIERGRPL